MAVPLFEVNDTTLDPTLLERVTVIAAICDSSSVYVDELNWIVGVAVAVAVGVPVCVPPGDDGVTAGVLVAVGVPVTVAVGVFVAVDVTVGVPLGDGHPVPPVTKRAMEKLPCTPEVPV